MDEPSEGVRRPRLIAVINHKGGVGKTTTAINLATGFAASGRKVLLVDLDPQGNAGAGLGFDKTDVFVGSMQLVVEGRIEASMMRETLVPGLRIIPATVGLARAEAELAGRPDGNTRLRDLMLGEFDEVDVVVFDCPPAVGILAVNALIAADVAIIPVQCESFALEGLKQILRTITQVRDGENPHLRYRIALTMRDAANALSGLVAQEVRAHFGDLVFATEIPREERISEAAFRGMPVLVLDHTCEGARAYIALTRELMAWERAAEQDSATLLWGGGRDPEAILDQWAAERGPVADLAVRAGESAASVATPAGWDTALAGDEIPVPARAGSPPLDRGLVLLIAAGFAIAVVGAVATAVIAFG